jgi:hypothetical protein
MVGAAASKLGPACDGVGFDLFRLSCQKATRGRIHLIIDKKRDFDYLNAIRPRAINRPNPWSRFADIPVIQGKMDTHRSMCVQGRRLLPPQTGISICADYTARASKEGGEHESVTANYRDSDFF